MAALAPAAKQKSPGKCTHVHDEFDFEFKAERQTLTTPICTEEHFLKHTQQAHDVRVLITGTNTILVSDVAGFRISISVHENPPARQTARRPNRATRNNTPLTQVLRPPTAVETRLLPLFHLMSLSGTNRLPHQHPACPTVRRTWASPAPGSAKNRLHRLPRSQ
jgi:hypothetical protein